MSKSIEDYRNIVKILKLQLMKIREENQSLAHTLGIASENEHSSFSPKITKYAQCGEPFAKNILIFLNFAHRCQLIGVAPEMIFRIADKKRDKQVSVSSMAQIMKRVKLRMTQAQIDQLLKLLSKSSHLEYDQYLRFLSAFQINYEKYPQGNSRTYVQLTLLKFGKECLKHIKDVQKLYLQLNKNQDVPFCSFDNMKMFVQKSVSVLSDVELVAIFVGLDLQSECKIEQDIFVREMSKIYSLLEKGVDVEDYQQDRKQSGKKEPNKKEPGRQTSTTKQTKDKFEKDDYQVDEQTGVEGGNKKKPATKPVQKQPQLSKGDSKKLIDELKKMKIRVSDLLVRLLSNEYKDMSGLVRSYTLLDFEVTLKALNDKTDRKKCIELFRLLDVGSNGTVSTSELLKFWLRGKELADSDDMLFRLLYRHLRQTQISDPILRFLTFGAKPEQNLSEAIFVKVFRELQLQPAETKAILQNIGNEMKLTMFSQLLKGEGKVPQTKVFKKMEKKQYEQIKSLLNKAAPKRNKGNKNFKKLVRLQTGQKNDQQTFWTSIFVDEWSCFEYCLETAAKLQQFWRDSEFGPTKGDPHGYRSIIGNESCIPPGLPDEQEIEWLTYEQQLAKQKNKAKAVYLQEKVLPDDVVQGKLGDCWFVSSLSIIAKNEQFIKGKSAEQCRKNPEFVTYGASPYLFKTFLKYGLYVVKFFKKFQAVYVVVDDLFPVQSSSGEWIFARAASPHKQWVSFLEKAYAKLHHAYSNMISGDIAQGLNDLTNALPIKENLEAGKEENWEKLTILNDEDQLMGCSIAVPKNAGTEAPVKLNGEKCGLFYGHAYSLLDVISLKTRSDKQEFHLLRIRNPWGHGEWILDWSDTPVDSDPDYQKLKKYQSDLNEYYKQKQQAWARLGRDNSLQRYESRDDGQFLMSFQDFNQIYTNLFTGYNFRRQYKCLQIEQRWDDKVPSGICKMKGATKEETMDFVRNNHQYVLQIKEDNTDVLMYVIQEDGRLYRGEKYPYKELCNGAMILPFQLKNNQPTLEAFDASRLVSNNLKFELRREVNLWKKFSVGKYAIIPCKIKNDIVLSSFQFRIYSDKPINIAKVRPDRKAFKPLADPNKELDKQSIAALVDFLNVKSQRL